jgi:hypothetical protein
VDGREAGRHLSSWPPPFPLGSASARTEQHRKVCAVRGSANLPAPIRR